MLDETSVALHGLSAGGVVLKPPDISERSVRQRTAPSKSL
jgi:hypothetical protein